MKDDAAVYSKVKADLAVDGSLRDVLIKSVGHDEWNRVLQLVKENWTHQFESDGAVRPLPADVSEVFELSEVSTVCLKMKVQSLLINCHFFRDAEIEFDIDPEEVSSLEGFRDLAQFIEKVAVTLGRTVEVTHEGAPELCFLKFDPSADRWDVLTSLH